VVVDGLALGFSDCVPGSYGCTGSEGHALGVRAEAELGVPLWESHWLTATVAGGEEWVVGDGSGRHQRLVATASVSDDWKLWSGRLELHPALRLDSIGEERALSPGLSLALRPSAALPGLVVRAGAGRSFRAPSFSELYLDLGAVAPNPALRPERATSVDAGVSLTTPRGSLSVGAFVSFHQDLVVYELFPPARIKPLNLGSARMLGLELQGSLRLPLGLLASLSWSVLDARSLRDSQTEGGERLPYRPPHRLFARLSHESERLEGFVELIATSETPRNAFGTAALRAQAGLNAGAFLRTVGPLWVGLQARNVLDDRTQQDLFLYPLPGLQLTALARARF
jgi:iron complex outermembrane receptor protein